MVDKKDNSYFEYLKCQFSVDMSKWSKEDISRYICKHYYSGLLSKTNLDTSSETITDQLPSLFANKESPKLLRWFEKDSWPDSKLKDSDPISASTIGWLFYLLLYREIPTTSTMNENIKLKSTNETPMNWQILLDDATKDNKIDPLTNPDRDVQMPPPPSPERPEENDDDVIIIDTENIESLTDIDDDNEM